MLWKLFMITFVGVTGGDSSLKQTLTFTSSDCISPTNQSPSKCSIQWIVLNLYYFFLFARLISRFRNKFLFYDLINVFLTRTLFLSLPPLPHACFEYKVVGANVVLGNGRPSQKHLPRLSRADSMSHIYYSLTLFLIPVLRRGGYGSSAVWWQGHVQLLLQARVTPGNWNMNNNRSQVQRYGPTAIHVSRPSFGPFINCKKFEQYVLRVCVCVCYIYQGTWNSRKLCTPATNRNTRRTTNI